MHAYIVAISRPVELTRVASVESQWHRIEQYLCQPNGCESRNKQCSVEREVLHDGRASVMCEALLIRKVGLVHATQDITIGLYKQTCKILLPVALCDSILVPDLRMSLVNGGSNVVVSVILRLAAVKSGR